MEIVVFSMWSVPRGYHENNWEGIYESICCRKILRKRMKIKKKKKHGKKVKFRKSSKQQPVSAALTV
jgi:hypothetical protein